MMVFSRCRGLEVNPTDTECVQKFLEMLDELQDVPITLTEQLLIWSAVRMMYRQAEPTHSKRWLTSTSELAEGNAFTDRPALDSFLQVAAKASEFSGLSEAHQSKARRWSRRSMSLFHKRVTALKEFGCRHPTWHQVKVCDLARDEIVPRSLLHNISRPVSRDKHNINESSDESHQTINEADFEESPREKESAPNKRKGKKWVSVPHYSPPAD
eukprot:TRINITY_DN5928_c0_g1_i1.p1 TRINITY_DN5928_c0_g1~~TRINITY_DN5928_c0_g1_i1.p1  ORF type:complete len:213 (+),score=30.95 TRINITY_DN5928_c0_g1_i1:658-1296(+)